MRLRIAFAMFAAPLFFASASAVERARADDSKLDKKVTAIVKQVADVFTKAKSLHVDISLEVTAERDGTKRKLDADASCDLQQPNHFAYRSRQKEDKEAGLEVVCDGKNLFTHNLKGKQYTVAHAPPDLREMGMTLFGLGQRRTGMLFVNVLTGDPYEQLMEGVNGCSYAGKEKVGDVEAYHLKFTQDAFDWEMWVAAEGKPFVLKMATVRSMDSNKFAMAESYRNWKLDAAPGKDVFSFSPPKDAKKVETLNDEPDARP